MRDHSIDRQADEHNAPPSNDELAQWYRDAIDAGATPREARDAVRERAYERPSLYAHG